MPITSKLLVQIKVYVLNVFSFGAVLRKVLVNCFKKIGLYNNIIFDFHFEKSYSF